MMAGMEYLPHHQAIRRQPVNRYLAYLTQDTAARYNEAAQIDKEAWEGIGTQPIKITTKHYSKADKQALAAEYQQKMIEKGA